MLWMSEKCWMIKSVLETVYYTQQECIHGNAEMLLFQFKAWGVFIALISELIALLISYVKQSRRKWQLIDMCFQRASILRNWWACLPTFQIYFLDLDRYEMELHGWQIEKCCWSEFPVSRSTIEASLTFYICILKKFTPRRRQSY